MKALLLQLAARLLKSGVAAIRKANAAAKRKHRNRSALDGAMEAIEDGHGGRLEAYMRRLKNQNGGEG